MRFSCEVVEKAVVRDWDVVKALSPYHGWTEEIVRDRFEWGGETPEIHAALVRVSALKEPWVFPFRKEIWRLSLVGRDPGTSREVSATGASLTRW